MKFEEVVQLIDGACWGARSWGHDDNGLEPEASIDVKTGEPPTEEVIEEDPYSDDLVHPVAYRTARVIWEEMQKQGRVV